MNFTDSPLAIKPPVVQTVAEPSEPCPKCGKPLVDATGLGWCADCGYCKTLANDETKQLLVEEKPSPVVTGASATASAIVRLPFWIWGVCLFGAVGVLFGVVMGRRLPLDAEFERATWATQMIASGVVAIFLSQVFALITIAPSEPTLTFKDALVSFRLWGLVFKGLPTCKECLWSAVLGLGLIVGGAAFVGGLSHWLEYLPSGGQSENARKQSTGRGTAIRLPE